MVSSEEIQIDDGANGKNIKTLSSSSLQLRSTLIISLYFSS